MPTRKDITDDPAALRRRINEYFDRCDAANGSPACLVCKDGCGDKCQSCLKKRMPYTLSGLCYSLGMTKRKFLSLKTNKCLSDIVEMALLRLERSIEESSYCGVMNGTLATAILRENFGWGETELPDAVRVELSSEAESYGG